MKDLRSKVALITGGACGLGEAISNTFAESGLKVVVADRNKEKAEALAHRLAQRGVESLALRMDVSKEEDVQTSIRTTLSHFGRLDVLVNNAGVDKTVSVEDLTIEDIDHVIGVNLRGPFLMSKLAFPVMKEQRSGHIINIASTASRRAWANATAYHASKWGLVGLSHALHVEGRPYGIKVTALLSGGMRTPFIMERFPDTPPEVLQDPKNVAETVLFLLQQPDETVIPEIMVVPMKETSWP